MDHSSAPKTPSRRWTLLLAVLAALLLAGSASAQVDVTATAGTPNASYLTLKDAFDAINLGTHQGVITIGISADTTETAPAVLNASGSGAASYTSIAISPTGGAARTISGAIAAGSPLIDLNGADNVTIDGLNTGGNSLTISNTTSPGSSGTSTIRFIGGATNNVVTNSSILGSFGLSVATNGGNIYFATDALTANGNDNNTISNNNIGPAGANLPTKGVYGNGSTTTAAIGNNGIVVTNNNIYDFFGAAVTSDGIYVAGGCSGWTITNNRFYQTGTRTWTTGANHRAIEVSNSTSTTGAQGFTITGNTIGYASSAGTGTYTLTGSTGKFAGIVFNGLTAGAASDISNNTIASVSLTGVTSSGTGTSSPFMAMLVTNGVANTNNNTIGSQSGTGSLTFSTNTTTSTDVYGIYNFSLDNWTANNNTFGSITANNAGATGAFIFYGLRANTSSTVAFNASGNLLGGTTTGSIQNNSTSTTAQMYGFFSSNARPNWVGNTVRNLTAAGGTGTGSTASVIGMAMTGTTATGNLISRNTIHALSNSNATAAVWISGVSYNGATTGTNVVERNFIHSLSTPSTSATATINGINVIGGLTTFQNNMIALGSDMTANSPQINGINETVAGTDNFYFNSVYIGGAAVAAGSANSFAFQSAITLNTRNYRDNVFYNARSNGAATGKHYAIRVGGTAPSPAGLTSNNNVLLANGTGGFTGLFNLVDQANLAAWQAATGQDANSFALDPQYLAPTAATPDLHINGAVLTVVEGNGTPIGTVTDDFDGQVRASLTPTDIGADAGNFLGVDLTPPAISYTALGNTSLTTNRTQTATLTDVTGVATGGLAPRICYRKNAGTYFSQACSLTGGTVNSGTWDCVINNADLGGVTTADVIAYFVIAQDTLGNVGSNPGGAVAVDVNNVTTPPASPNTYTIVTAFTGSYDIGTGQTYTSLTNAGGVFEAINAGALTGNVVLNIVSDLAGELGTNALNQWAEDGVGGYTMLIKPSGAPRTITGSNTGALIRFFGTDRLRLDGSTAATFADAPTPGDAVGGDPLLRELTIQNTNTGTSAVVIAVMTGAAGAQNVTLKNLNVLGQDPTTTLAGIALGGNTPGTAGTDNDNNRVENCAVKRAIYGIYSAGQSAVNPNLGSVIAQNDLSATTTDRIRRVGIVVFNEDGVQITENSVGGLDTNESVDGVGIGVGTQGLDTTTTTSGGVSNALVSRNKVNGVNSASTVGFSAAGIAVAGGTAGPNTVVNNMITGVTAPSTSPDIPAGIFVAGVTGSTTRLYYNSVSMTGDRGVVASQTPSFALAVTGTDPTVVLRDNLLATTQIASGGGVNAKSYAIGMVTTAFANLDSNYNGFFSSGANAGFFRSGSLTAGAGTDYPNLAGWQAAVADDASSFEADPLYTSTSDLHLLAGSPALLAGTPVAGVTVDFDAETRSGIAPTVGADEVAVPADLSITKTDGVTTAIPGGSVTYTIVASNAGSGPVSGATVADTFPAVLTCTWTCAGAAGGTCTASGSGNINDTVNLPVGGSATYTASCSVSLAATGTLANTATVSSSVSDPVPGNNSATDTDNVAPLADVSITKTDGVGAVTPGGATTYTITASNAGPAATAATVADTFPASLSCTWTCAGAGGGACAASGSGNINDATVSLPAGGSVTYTAPCTVSPSASGTVVNTATVTPVEIDPTPGNNSATDTDVVSGSAPPTSVVREAEPNGTPATATPLGGRNVRVLASVYPNADEDFYSFTAQAGDKVYAATMTSFSASGSTDSVLDLYASDGTTVIESDDNDGSYGASASTIAGATLPSAGTYYLRVKNFSATSQLRPYELWVRLQSGAESPVPETEPNDTPATANPLPGNGWVSGARNPAVGTEQDWYSFTANAGDTVFMSLDLDPERDNVQWNGRLGIALFGDAGNQILVVDDGSTGSATNPLSEALVMTVKTSGTYYAFVDSATAATGGPTATYALSVSVHPALTEGVNCTTYTSTDVPQTIGPGATLVSSTITIPGNPRIADLDVSVQLDHAQMNQIDAHLRSPAGNDNGLFTDIGATATGGQTQMDATFDDEAAIPPLYTVLKNLVVKPELSYRLSWFDGEDAGGTWTLDLRDDVADTNGGTLTGWSLRVCEPAPAPTCPVGTGPVTVYSSDFEANDGGFTHAGTQDEWALGLPSAVPITTCNSGVNCWKTDLTGTYNASSDQNLLSPAIDLSTAGLVGPVLATWHQRYQMESASFDHAFVDAQDVDAGATPKRLWEWLDATMTDAVGSPSVTIQESAGWGRRTADVSSFLGQNDFQLRFHVDSDTTIQYGGLAIDDVTVTACQPLGADLSITKTDGLATATPGTSTTYTITASNAGPQGVTGATVADTFPAVLTCNWTCVGAGGGTCTAAGAGNINDSVNLPNGGSVTYTATCNIAASAFGTLSNTATVSSATSDPNPGNNSATDTDTLTPSADLSITKADDVDPIGVHRDLTWSITVTNNGPSDSGSSTVTDVLPAGVSFVSASVNCGEAGGTVTCNIPNLAPAGAQLQTIVVRTTQTGNLNNTASVAGSVTDPTPGNNSDSEATAVQFRKGDFENDLQTDLYIGNTVAPDNHVWLMNGVARTSELTFSPVPASVAQQVSGVDDFNGDSWNDLVFWNSSTGAVEFWFMNGTATRVGAAVPLSGGPTLATNWKLSATADFNADGKPDIVWRNFTSQKIVIWTMNGTAKLGNIIPSPDQAVDFNWEIVGAFDMNNDGATDFLWYNSTSGKIVYWWMNSSVVRITGAFTNPANAGDNNWKVLAAGDYGLGTGGTANTKDIVWRNATSGKYVVWYMDFAGNRTFGEFTSPTNPSPNPTNWTIVGPR